MKTRRTLFTILFFTFLTATNSDWPSTAVVGATVVQAKDSPYLSQMPAVERVMREVKGGDQIDTAARQAGVFWQLREVIDALAKSQGRNQFRLTADEEALKQKYYVAYYNVWQPVQKALAQDGPRLFKLEGYTVDRDLLVDVLERLGSPALRAVWSRVRGESLARTRAQVQAQHQAAQPPPGTSALKVWLSACTSRQPLCQQGMMMGQAATAAGVVVDANGRAQFSGVPPGTYFVFGSTQYNNQPFLWDLRVDLKPGTNTVTLDQRNSAVQVQRPGQVPLGTLSATPQPSGPTGTSAVKPADKGATPTKGPVPHTPLEDHYAKGEELVKAGEYQKALTQFQQLIALKPRKDVLGNAYSLLGWCYDAHGEFEKALPNYLEAYGAEEPGNTGSQNARRFR
ncbi:MAG: tetratricopeptide repeat protein [Acidobacteriota bacterium]